MSRLKQCVCNVSRPRKGTGFLFYSPSDDIYKSRATWIIEDYGGRWRSHREGAYWIAETKAAWVCRVLTRLGVQMVYECEPPARGRRAEHGKRRLF